jgi:hypothetical protein
MGSDYRRLIRLIGLVQERRLRQRRDKWYVTALAMAGESLPLEPGEIDNDEGLTPEQHARRVAVTEHARMMHERAVKRAKGT